MSNVAHLLLNVTLIVRRSAQLNQAAGDNGGLAKRATSRFRVAFKGCILPKKSTINELSVTKRALRIRSFRIAIHRILQRGKGLRSVTHLSRLGTSDGHLLL